MLLLLFLLMQNGGPAQDADRAAAAAYAELRAGRLDAAVAGFEQALRLQPELLHVRKDLAYTLLRRGDRERARDEFEAVERADARDEQAALEYAFLCHETHRTQAARRVFARLRLSPDEGVRATAATAFDNIDRPLAEGIVRWQEATARAPRQWSAHEELARLAEMRDQLALAAEHYEIAWRLRPHQDSLLIDLARVLSESGDAKGARAALVAAYRSPVARVSETARELMNGRTPGPQEAALAAPDEAGLLAANHPAKDLGRLYLEQRALGNARRYYTQAHKENPEDAEVLYQLGVTSNLLKLDRDALKWFDRASNAPDPVISVRARDAYQTLSPLVERVKVSAWAIPIYSSRWRDTFLYGQAKTEWQARHLPFSTYLSLRFVGDTSGWRRPRLYSDPMFLSERSAVLGMGISRQINTHLRAWAEAGQYLSYADTRFSAARSRPDYRGGLAWLKGFGHLLGAPEAGRFFEQNADGVYSSRFDNDLLLYVQNRAGWTTPRGISGLQAQFYALGNIVADSRGEYWGNSTEAGVGGRYALPGLPRGMTFRTEVVRGAHLKNTANPWRPNFWDVRIGMWYGFSH